MVSTGLVVGNFQNHPEQRRGKDLPLRVGLEGKRTPTIEGAVQQKVERLEIRKLVSFDVPADHASEVLSDAIASDILLEKGIPLGLECDDTDIRRVTLVSRSGVRDVDQLDPCHATSTFVCTTRWSMRAGQ